MTKKISQLTALTTPADDDVIVINDTSTGITKKMSRSDFFGGLVPPGLIAQYAAATAPTGWLLCNGTDVSRSTYSDLFAAIGISYGAGDGSTTFTLPNFKGKVGVGLDASQTEFNALAKTGGEKSHALTLGEMAVHSHTISDPGHAHSVYDPGHSHGSGANYFMDAGGSGNLGLNTPGNRFAQGLSPLYINGAGTGIGIYGSTTGISIANSGSGSAHNNLQPYVVSTFIIKT